MNTLNVFERARTLLELSKKFHQPISRTSPSTLLEAAAVSITKKSSADLEMNMFLDYASRYWGQHIRMVQEQVYELASGFL